MANFNSTRSTATPKNQVGVNAQFDTVAVTGQVATDTITMLAQIPLGAVIIGVGISGTAALFATSCTLQVGDGTTASRFGIANVLTSPSTFIPSKDFTPLTADTSIVITISAASGAAGAQTLGLTVIYTMNSL